MKYKKVYLFRYFLLNKNLDENTKCEVFLRRDFVPMKNHFIYHVE